MKSRFSDTEEFYCFYTESSFKVIGQVKSGNVVNTVHLYSTKLGTQHFIIHMYMVRCKLSS